ncbi:MAG: hypothetical protein K2K54_07740 [Lachnospiraceae bacterium]|nr:hypothetical protein [Lachnospiraceae bacterium]
MTAENRETIDIFHERIETALEAHEQADCILQCANLIVFMHGLKENKEITYREFRQTIDYCADTYRTLFGI